ncbi:MAG: hypothetical protein LBF37_00220 [Rickettsiales bacterium]|jgi:hypothetical protein|nr:hypothetical protein [Rickettsiales bacterium]
MVKIKVSSVGQFDEAWATTFRLTYTSSAKNFEKLLLKNEVKPPFKLHYEYILPNNWGPIEFEKNLKKIQGHLMIESPRITRFFDINVETVEKIREIRKKDLLVLKMWATEIQNKNQELSHIKLMDYYDQAGFVDGAIYGFAPEEISYYLDQQRDQGENPQQNLIRKKYSEQLEELLGGSINYKISPEKLKKIIEITKEKKTEFARSGVKISKRILVDSFGREDPTGFLSYHEQRTRGDD